MALIDLLKKEKEYLFLTEGYTKYIEILRENNINDKRIPDYEKKLVATKENLRLTRLAIKLYFDELVAN